MIEYNEATKSRIAEQLDIYELWGATHAKFGFMIDLINKGFTDSEKAFHNNHDFAWDIMYAPDKYITPQRAAKARQHNEDEICRRWYDECLAEEREDRFIRICLAFSLLMHETCTVPTEAQCRNRAYRAWWMEMFSIVRDLHDAGELSTTEVKNA
jgi:hypothetical protein